MDHTHPSAPRFPRAADVSDAELDAAILARLELLGVDLSVLPADDAEAPADRRRILASARRFLRSTPGAIADFAMDPQEVPPVMYPAEWAALLGDEPRSRGGA
jgi:hypothetical protein